MTWRKDAGLMVLTAPIPRKDYITKQQNPQDGGPAWGQSVGSLYETDAGAVATLYYKSPASTRSMLSKRVP